jgi:hypothetical protein
MKLRTLAITVALLAALSAIAYFKNRPEAASSADPRVGKALLDADTVSRASLITVSDQGKKVELARAPDGSWRVKSYFDLPADFEKVSRLVQDLNEAKADRFVTANPDRLSHLEFKDSQISLGDSSGKPIWILTLGKSPESGNGRFIRFDDEPKAYFSGMHVWLDTEAKGWANAQLIDVKKDDVSRIEIPFDSGKTVVVSRAKKDSPWTAADAPAGRALDSDKVSSVLAALTSLRFSDTTDTKDPSAAEAARYARTFRVSTFNGATLTITLGRRPEQRKLKPPVADAKDSLASIAKAADGSPEPKPITPEFDTTPAGPVFAGVSSSDPAAAVNDLMKRRAYQVDEFTFTGLPQNADDLFQAAKGK